MQRGVILGGLVVFVYLIVLLSNFWFYRRFPRERWPMVMAATSVWWGPVTGLGLLWGLVPLWFAGVQLGCLVSAFLATMTLKLLQYRSVAFRSEKPHLAPWQTEMLADVEYSLDRGVQHIDSAIANHEELAGLWWSVQQHQAALDEAIRQMKLYLAISQQTLDDFRGGVVSSYLARKQDAEADMVREEAREE